MKTCIILAILVAVAVVAEGHGGKRGHAKTCKGEQMIMPDNMKEIMQECKPKSKSEDRHKMMQKGFCCMMEKQGIYNSQENKLSKEKFVEVMTGMFPKNGQSVGQHIVEKCFTEENTKNLSKDDPSTFQPFITCLFQHWKEACGAGKKSESQDEDDD